MIYDAITIGFGILWVMIPLHFLGRPLPHAWRESEGKPWNHKFVWIIFTVILIVNLVLAPGFIYRRIVGASLIVFFAAHAIFSLRLIVARIRNETGPGWIAWSFLIWTSPLWISAMINFRFKIPWDIGR
jgi:hypothetical protein